MGVKHFKINPGTKAITTKAETESVSRGNVRIHVIDTPGFQSSEDFSKLGDVLKNHHQRNVACALVIQIGRYTTEERHVIEDLFKKNKSILKPSIIIFTNREVLDDELDVFDQTIDGWLQKNKSLLSLIKNYKLKYRAFENKRIQPEENDRQVRDLMSAIRENDLTSQFVSVSDSKKKKEELIYVSRKLMTETFGTNGTRFFDEQLAIQKNDED